MSSNLFVLFEGLLSFGLVVGLCVWQLAATDKAKKARIARENAKQDARDSAG